MVNLSEKQYNAIVINATCIVTPADEGNAHVGGKLVKRTLTGEVYRLFPFKDYYSIFPNSRLRIMLISEHNPIKVKAIKAMLKERGVKG